MPIAPVRVARRRVSGVTRNVTVAETRKTRMYSRTLPRLRIPAGAGSRIIFRKSLASTLWAVFSSQMEDVSLQASVKQVVGSPKCLAI